VRRGGTWKISTFHAGVDPDDNVIMSYATGAAKRYIIVAGIAGAFAGLVLGWLIARQRA
jgi:hypothetical protein